MNLVNHIGSVSIKMESIGLEIEIKDIRVETQDISPADHLAVSKVKKEQVEEIKESIKSLVGLMDSVKSPFSPSGGSADNLPHLLAELAKNFKDTPASFKGFAFGESPFGGGKFDKL